MKFEISKIAQLTSSSEDVGPPEINIKSSSDDVINFTMSEYRVSGLLEKCDPSITLKVHGVSGLQHENMAHACLVGM